MSAQPATMTIRAFVASLKQRKSSAMNIANTIGALNRLCQFLAQRGCQLETATELDLLEYLNEVGEGQTVGTWNRRRETLNSFYKWLATDAGTANPMRRIRPAAVTEPDPEMVPEATEDQYRALLATCLPKRGHRRSEYQLMIDARDAAIIALLWWTGLRRGSLAGIDIRYLDLDRQTVHIVASNSKARTTGDVFIDDEAMEHVLRWLRYRGDSPGPLFWSTKSRGLRPIQPNTIQQIMQRRCELAGIDVDRFGAHAFRRARASNWLDAGGNETDLCLQMLWKAGSPQPARYARKGRIERSVSESGRVNEAVKQRRHLRAV